MKVKYLGFEISTEKNLITISDFIENNLVFDMSDILERNVLIDCSHSDYYKGLILTVKDQKAFCKLQGNVGDLEITVENLSGGDQLIEFNFFVINKKTGKGLYQFYYQSTSLAKFKEILKRKFLSYRAILIQSEYDSNITLGKSDGVSKRNANKKYLDKISLSLLVKPQTLSQLLQKCKQIKSFEVEFSTYEYIRKHGLPMPAHATKLKQKVYFDKDTKVKELAASIVSFVGTENPVSGTIMVLDEFGQEMPYKLMDTPDLFHEEEFDDLVQKLNSVKVGSFANSAVLDEMISICQTNTVLK